MVDRTVKISNGLLLAVRDGEISEKAFIGILAIKLNYVDSIMRNVSIRNFAKLLHCGKDTATEILKDIKYTCPKAEEDGNLNIQAPIKTYERYDHKKIGGKQKLYIRNGKLYLIVNDKNAKGYDITYRNLKKIISMLLCNNFIQQTERIKDLGHFSRGRKRLNCIKQRKYKDVETHVKKNSRAYKDGVNLITISRNIKKSKSTAQRIIKSLLLAGVISVTNDTDFHTPVADLDYDTVLSRKCYNSNYKAKEGDTTLDAFKRMLSKPDAVLIAHKSIMQHLEWSGHKCVKSVLVDKYGEDGEKHTHRYYYAIHANKYKSLV